jgi:hypothetical protein
MSAQLNEVYGLMREDGNVDILYINDGDRVTRLNVEHVYPVGSQLATTYCHAKGIVLTVEQCEELNIEIEYVNS